MFRMIRTSTLRGLREDVAEADEAAQTYSAEAEKWHKEYVKEGGRADVAEAAAEALRADLETQETGLMAVIRQTSRERDAARRERDDARERADVVAEMRADLDRLRAAAADTETGSSVRGAIALGVILDWHQRARAEGITPGRPWDLLAAVLQLDGDAGAREEEPEELPADMTEHGPAADSATD